MKKIIFLLSFLSSLYADCVFGAKDSINFIVLDSHTIVLKGGYSPILIRTYCYVSSYSEVTVLKDDFCSYEDSVLYVDGEVCDVNEVKEL